MNQLCSGVTAGPPTKQENIGIQEYLHYIHFTCLHIIIGNGIQQNAQPSQLVYFISLRNYKMCDFCLNLV